MELGPAGVQLMNMLPFIILMVIFYFFIYRPQKKEQEKRKDMLNTLHKGNKVLTLGGIYGEIIAINDKEGIIDLKIADKVIVKISKGAVHKNISQGKEGEMATGLNPEDMGEAK